MTWSCIGKRVPWFRMVRLVAD